MTARYPQIRIVDWASNGEKPGAKDMEEIYEAFAQPA